MSGKYLKNNKHHVEPKSRTKENKRCKKVKIPTNFHSSWNMIFSNLYGEELIVFIKEINFLMETEEEINWKDINRIRNEIRELNLNGEKRENILALFFKNNLNIFNDKEGLYQHEQA
jgi:hypothetical protein